VCSQYCLPISKRGAGLTGLSDETTMRRSYAKSAGLALLIHIALLGLSGLVVGWTSPAAPHPPPPIVIDIEPPKLLSMGNGLRLASSGAAPGGPKTEEKPKAAAEKEVAPPPPAPKPEVKPKIKPRAHPKPKRPKTAPARARTEAPLPPALPGEPTTTSVALPAREDVNTQGEMGKTGANDPSGTVTGVAGTGRIHPSGAGGRGGKGEGGAYTGAGYRSGPLPDYPSSERSSGREGIVTVRVLVGTDGVPDSVAVRSTSGSAAFDSAAVKAVKRWRFSPATKGGTPVASFFDVRVRFRLEDAR
jgi:periplasmic protein TonB